MPRTFAIRLLPVIALMLAATPASGAEYGEKILSYCSSKLGDKVGSGECAHLATEALRASGAEFTRNGMSDSPATGDYVWGKRIKRLDANGAKVVDSAPSSKCKRGDILQYRLGSSKKTHHTAIVAEVDSKGYPTRIYQQNFNKQRHVTRDSTDLFAELRSKGGYIQVYRAVDPVSRSRTEFTLRNNSKSDSVSFKIGSSSYTLGDADTSSGYSWRWSTASPVKLTVYGTTHTISHRSAYEFYTSGGKVLLRKIN